MNILYGLSGEGFGHASRALAIIPFLQKQGHCVKILTYGKAYDVLKDKFDVKEIKGMHLIFHKDKIHKTKTVIYNLKNFPKNLAKREEYKKLIEEFNPDVFITDYEPLTYVLSKIYKKKLISIGNHQIIDNFKIKIPKKYYQQYVLTKVVNKMFTPSADYFIITSFLKSAKINKNTIIASPIIRNEVRKLKPKNNGKILVYLNKTNYALDILKNINEKFVVYGFDKKNKDGNIEFKTKETFLKDLKDCKAIIATAGFSLISEALYLKKPLLAIPQKGQFEQVFNALTLKEKGFGDFYEKLDEKDIIEFISKLDIYKKNLKNYQFNPVEVLEILDNVLNKIEYK